jgi:cellobiose-specific phosphotransferase system component IIC
MKGTEYFVSLLTSVVTTERYNVMVNSGDLIRTPENVTL